MEPWSVEKTAPDLRKILIKSISRWPCNIVDWLKLDLCTIRWRLSGLEVKRSRARPNVFSSITGCRVLKIHWFGVTDKDEIAVWYLQDFNGFLAWMGLWFQWNSTISTTSYGRIFGVGNVTSCWVVRATLLIIWTVGRGRTNPPLLHCTWIIGDLYSIP